MNRRRLLLLLAAAWVLVAGLVLTQVAPSLPRNKLEWFLVIVAGPPLYLLAEGFFGWLFSPQRGREISARSFSMLRIFVGLAVVLALLGIGLLLAFAVRVR